MLISIHYLFFQMHFQCNIHFLTVIAKNSFIYFCGSVWYVLVGYLVFPGNILDFPFIISIDNYQHICNITPNHV